MNNDIMNDNVYKNSYGIEPIFDGNQFYTRKIIITNETILDKIPINEIEQFLRKKKLEKLKYIK